MKDMKEKIENKLKDLNNQYQKYIESHGKLKKAIIHCETEMVGLERTITEFNKLLNENNKEESKK